MKLIYSTAKPNLQGKAPGQYVPTWNTYNARLTNMSKVAINHNLEAKMLRLQDEVERAKAKQKLLDLTTKQLKKDMDAVIAAEEKGINRGNIKVDDVIFCLAVDPPQNDDNHIPSRTYGSTRQSILTTAYYRNERMELVHNEGQAVHVIGKRATASDLCKLSLKSTNPTIFASYKAAMLKAEEYDKDKAGAEEIYKAIDKKALRAYYGLK